MLAVEPNQTIRYTPEPLPPPAPERGVDAASTDEPENDPTFTEQSLPESSTLKRPQGRAPQSIARHTASPDPVVPNDPRYRSQWNLKKIGMEQALAITTGSTNVVVAVIDTGVNYLHSDLAANMWRNPGETGLDAQGRDKATNGIDDDGNGYVDDVYGIDAVRGTGDPMDAGLMRSDFVGLFPHGTACAGVIAATGNNGVGCVGMNWHSSIMALRFSGGNDPYIDPTSDFVECINYLITMKRRGVNVRIAGVGSDF